MVEGRSDLRRPGGFWLREPPPGGGVGGGGVLGQGKGQQLVCQLLDLLSVEHFSSMSSPDRSLSLELRQK